MSAGRKKPAELVGATETAEAKPVDPFDDLANLRLRQDFATTGATRRLLTVIPVDRPSKQAFIRIHPNHALDAGLIDLRDDMSRERYLVLPELQADLAGEWAPYRLFLGTTQQNAPFIWPVRLPGDEGRTVSWYESAMEAATLARDQWLRVVPDMGLGGYLCHAAVGDLGAPVWPEESFAELLKVAFRGRVVDRADHPLIARLRGGG